MDFYFEQKSQASHLVEYLQSVVPIKFVLICRPSPSCVGRGADPLLHLCSACLQSDPITTNHFHRRSEQHHSIETHFCMLMQFESSWFAPAHQLMGLFDVFVGGWVDVTGD
jgi:hypothetical protein